MPRAVLVQGMAVFEEPGGFAAIPPWAPRQDIFPWLAWELGRDLPRYLFLSTVLFLAESDPIPSARVRAFVSLGLLEPRGGQAAEPHKGCPVCSLAPHSPKPFS